MMLYALLQFIYKGFTVHNVSPVHTWLMGPKSWWSSCSPHDKTSNMREWVWKWRNIIWVAYKIVTSVHTFVCRLSSFGFFPLAAWTEKCLMSEIFSCLIYLRHIKCHHRYRCHLKLNLKLQLMIPHNNYLNSN